MKKLLIVLLALTVLGIFAFADDAAPAPALVLSGSVQVGMQIATSSTLQNWSSNDPDNAALYLDGTFAGTNAGGKFELLSKGGATPYSVAGAAMPWGVGIDTAFGWWKPIDMLTVRLGYNYGSTYSTPIEGWANGGNGGQIALTPIEGFTVALDIDAPNAPTTFDASKMFGFDAQYAIKDIATIGLDYDLGSKILYAGANVVAVPNLTAQLDVKYDGSASSAVTTLEENFAYAMGALKPSLWVQEVSASSFTWAVKPGVAYTLGSVTPSANFQYNSDASWSFGAAADLTVEKNAIHFYVDYKSSAAYDAGIRYIVSF